MSQLLMPTLLGISFISNSSSTGLERSIAREAGKISSTLSKAKGSTARHRDLAKTTHFVVGAGVSLDIAAYMEERDDMQIYTQ